MARTLSTMLELGTQAPDFNLENNDGKMVRRDDCMGSKGLLVAFICNHCPYVIHIIEPFVAMAKKYQQQGIGVVIISSNDIDNYPDDSPEKMREFAEKYGFSFPYLYDESQSVAKSYMAACTPDLYLFDQDAHLIYRGQFDTSRPKSGEAVTGIDMKSALDGLLSGNSPVENQVASMGCNIKWKPGNEPAYYG